MTGTIIVLLVCLVPLWASESRINEYHRRTPATLSAFYAKLWLNGKREGFSGRRAEPTAFADCATSALVIPSYSGALPLSSGLMLSLTPDFQGSIFSRPPPACSLPDGI